MAHRKTTRSPRSIADTLAEDLRCTLEIKAKTADACSGLTEKESRKLKGTLKDFAIVNKRPGGRGKFDATRIEAEGYTSQQVLRGIFHQLHQARGPYYLVRKAGGSGFEMDQNGLYTESGQRGAPVLNEAFRYNQQTRSFEKIDLPKNAAAPPRRNPDEPYRRPHPDNLLPF